METGALTPEEFDALVTGELTHLAIWLEDELNCIISGYFVGSGDRSGDFNRLVLYRDGLTFQAKLEVVKSMFPLFGTIPEERDLKGVLKEVEEFKTWRNAAAHGFLRSSDAGPIISIAVVSRSGRERIVEITPESHAEMTARAEGLLERLTAIREEIFDVHGRA